MDRRHDPLVNTDLVDKLKDLRGMIVSGASALILAWQWLRRRRTEGTNDYLGVCNKLELGALRSASRGEFGEADLRAVLVQLTTLKIDVLERHEEGAFNSEESFNDLLSRIDRLREALPGMVQVNAAELAGGRSLAGPAEDASSLALPKPRRKAG